ncbi:phosphatase PAP2 family protein [Neobacillus mesonae]|uniref:phosphatase PAP2 family protein n=1 Tax=Neobacillus mesonae TaxID=1193713 RepID=UPI00203B22ED|nr:phosphatase PAP2 family protein [Neobacillus mesonae]MCM3569036.1 phosphatase PAP2 family protein [Neobacillus mesonae]
MTRIFHVLYGYECRVFQGINRHFERVWLNFFFRMVTHLGGARFTISAVVLLYLTAWSKEYRLLAIASAMALSSSHIPVQLVKMLFPRKRPYLTIEKTKFPENPLKDHSFPSGHTTAVFAILTPYILFIPHISIILILIGLSVGISRIYLGLHYPSDVMAGALLGICAGGVSYLLLCV